MPYLVPDYETRGLCDLTAAGADAYAEDFSTEVLCLDLIASTGEHVIWYPGDPVPELWTRALADGWMFIAHNARFERAITRCIMGQYGFPDVPVTQWHDTMARCANLVLPMKLEKVAEVLGLNQRKDMEGSRLVKALRTPNRRGNLPDLTPTILHRVGQYCTQDTRTQLELHQRIGWLDPGERKVWLLNQKMNDRGVKLDMPLVRNMQRIVDEASAPLEDRFRELTGFNITQGQKVKSWMHEQGAHLPDLQKETVAKWLGKDVDGEVGEDDLFAGKDDAQGLIPEVREALEIKQLIGSSSIKKLARMEQCVSPDGRAHGLLMYHGTGPGRQAGRLFQPHNFPRGTLVFDKSIKLAQKQSMILEALNTGDWEYVEAVIGPAVETVVSSLRYCMVAEQGHEYVAGDFAGIQARVVLSIAGEYEKTALMAAGADVYIDMACDIWPELPRPNWAAGPEVFGPQVEAFKKAFAEQRGTGKNSVLGLGFQMGGPKFQWKYATDRDLEFCLRVVNTYRKEWAPGVPKVWYALQDAAVAAVWDGGVHEAYGIEYVMEDRWLSARLPSGRKMWYFDAKPIRKAMPWDPDDIRRAFQYRATKTGQLKTIDAFGGQLTENYVMGIERDLMTHAMFRCERENLPVILDVHDEILIEPKSGPDNRTLLQQIMEDRPRWAVDMRIPVGVEVWSNDRYRK